MLRTLLIAGLLSLGSLLSACATTDTSGQADPVPEIHPGILQGYLPMDAALRSIDFVPPAPEPGSPRQMMDDRVVAQMLALRGSARWELAIADARLLFPGAAEVFECALGIPVTEEATPALYMLLRRTLADLGLATESAKKGYQRERPFMVNGEPLCTPDEEEMLRKDGSYPSGHTAIGWGWGLILSELAPERSEAVIARARAFGESRNVCNVHWRSDIVAGRMVGAAAVTRLHNNAAFRDAMVAARRDIDRARDRGLSPSRDCDREAAALAEMP
jgi:acid phosphatase (class A)